MSTVRCSSWPSATARLKAIVVLPTPPFGAKTEMTRVSPDRRSSRRTPCGRPAMRFIRSNPENGIDRTPWMPALGVHLDRVLRHGQHDDRARPARRVDLLDELGALDPALQQRIDQHDVRAELADLGDRLAAVAQDVEQLHRCWVFSRPRMYCATCGTSSTIRRRVWSLSKLDMGLDDTTGPVGGHRPDGSRPASVRRQRFRR